MVGVQRAGDGGEGDDAGDGARPLLLLGLGGRGVAGGWVGRVATRECCVAGLEIEHEAGSRRGATTRRRRRGAGGRAGFLSLLHTLLSLSLSLIRARCWPPAEASYCAGRCAHGRRRLWPRGARARASAFGSRRKRRAEVGRGRGLSPSRSRSVSLAVSVHRSAHVPGDARRDDRPAAGAGRRRRASAQPLSHRVLFFCCCERGGAHPSSIWSACVFV